MEAIVSKQQDDHIVEAWAKRLYEAGCAAGGPSPSTRKRAVFWKAQAREVMRQIEWAYLRGKEPAALAASTGYEWNDLPVFAPDDWNPT